LPQRLELGKGRKRGGLFCLSAEGITRKRGETFAYWLFWEKKVFGPGAEKGRRSLDGDDLLGKK